MSVCDIKQEITLLLLTFCDIEMDERIKMSPSLMVSSYKALGTVRRLQVDIARDSL